MHVSLVVVSGEAIHESGEEVSDFNSVQGEGTAIHRGAKIVGRWERKGNFGN